MKIALIGLSLFAASLLGGCASSGGYGSAASVRSPDIHPWEQNCHRQSFPQCGNGG